MKKLLAVAALGMALALPACSGADEEADDAAMAGADGADAGMDTAAADSAAMGGSGAAGSWPEGSRIVEEGGVTYRVDSAGTRVQLTPNDARIVTENNMRYRVDPGGSRVEIDDTGAAIRIGDSVITGNAPNGASDIETPGETVTDAAEDAAEAVGDVVD